MAFISAKNFLAPLTSTFHLVTILLIALIFVILRWSGFGTSVSDYHPTVDRAVVNAVSPRQASNPPVNSGASQGVRIPAPPSRSGAALIEDVRRTGEPDPNAAKEPARPNSFDDIQRKLGLK